MTTPTEQLGRLERVTVRDVWADEARDFTPWLAREDNIALLGETIGLELEVEAQERSVGPFRADILCKNTDPADEHWILIENQLERTDHNHLGQLLTYAAGLDAATIIWIADRFTEEHRAALDWLNEITAGDFSFFGLEVELWKIGGSQVAPKFNVISKPNDWTATVTRASRSLSNGELTETKRLQLEYWTKFWALLEAGGSHISGTKARPQHWNFFSIGRSNFGLSAVIHTKAKWIRVELYCDGPHEAAHFQLLKQNRAEIEREAGMKLDWQELPSKKSSRIAITKSDTDPADSADWPAQHAWITNQLETFDRVFRPRIRALDADDYEAEEMEDAESGED